ncbi:kinase-like protein [Gigaspora margarita]|uniref:Kinase-like protein n=1 Tax=Gigaspora margarita TaxID=4874 RepID=A0A8H4AQP6_GIGMA|nr:kinase-like protein [Gigaspora margarita]
MDGERPQIKGVPEFYKNLMISCWDNDPNNRPTIDEIVEIVKTWVYSPDEPSEEIKKEIERAEEILKKNSFTEVPSIHFQAYSMSNSFLTLSVLIEEFSTLGIDLTITT